MNKPHTRPNSKGFKLENQILSLFKEGRSICNISRTLQISRQTIYNHLQNTPIKVFKVASLFSGVGGLDYGFHKNPNFEVVFANDFDKDACETYRKNLGEIQEGDITQFIDQIPQHDVLIGGFPCSPFTLCGKRQGFSDEKGRGLQYKNCVLSLQKYQPSLFVFENVKGLMNHKTNNESTLEIILNDLKSCGYKVDHHLIFMPDYGVPQKRERIFIVGVRNDINIDPTQLIPPKPNITKSLLLKDNLPFPEPGIINIPNHEIENVININEIVVECDENLINLNQNEYKKRCENALLNSSLCSGFDGLLPVFSEGIQANSSQGYKRPNPIEIAPTVCFGNTKGILHPFQPRRLTIREHAYLQSFPNNFIFMGSKSAQRLQVGNAVPPLFSCYLAEHLSKIITPKT